MQTKPLQMNHAGQGLARIDLHGRAPRWLGQADGDLDGVRWEKVLTLKAAIACGRYNISSEALAEKLILNLFPAPPTTPHSFDGTKDRA